MYNYYISKIVFPLSFFCSVSVLSDSNFNRICKFLLSLVFLAYTLLVKIDYFTPKKYGNHTFCTVSALYIDNFFAILIICSGFASYASFGCTTTLTAPSFRLMNVSNASFTSSIENVCVIMSFTLIAPCSIRLNTVFEQFGFARTP